MRTVKTKVYSIDELSKEAKEKAIKDWIETDELEFLSEDLSYKLEELLKEHKIEGDAKIYYSLSYCQGDGAMFEGSFEWKGYEVEIEHNGHYYHYNSKMIGISDNNGKDVSEKIEKEFNNLYVKICKELEEYGYDCIGTSQEDESVVDAMKASDHEFTEDGEMY
ncbi:hypothetical protein LCGC14_1098120 [marine sediment metagenome]|uniref:Uncharacterized protein n=1 Tax=marine sediment metagenome TaxID=412755 RepID=A0A0F9MAG0_9ZZZZ